MVFLLLIILSCSIFVLYNLRTSFGSPYLFSPDIVILSAFFISVIVAWLNVGNWGDISSLTLLIIIASLYTFILGGALVDKKSKKNNSSFPIYYIPNQVTIVVCIVMSIVAYYDYIDIVNMVGKAGLGLMMISTMARDAIYSDEEVIKHSMLLNLGIYASRAIAYVYMYIICYNKIICNGKFKWLYLVPIFIYSVQIILSTGRSEFIYLIYGFLIIGYILEKTKSGWVERRDRLFIKYALWGATFFLILFIYMGTLRTNNEEGVIDSTGVHIGSTIPALNQYLEDNGIESNALFWGEQTQALYYAIGNSLGFAKEKMVDTLPPIDLKSGEFTNIYTCIARYLHDYGLVTTLSIFFFLGYFFSRWFYGIKKKGTFGIGIILYSFYSYPLAEFAIEERFMSNFLTARSVYVTLFLFFFYKFLLYKKT